MAYTQDDIIAAYNQMVGSGAMSEADFVNQAMNTYGVSAGQLQGAQSAMQAQQAPASYDPGPAAPSAPAGNPAYYGGGRAATDSELSNARSWASGKDMNTIMQKASSMGLTADQLGSVLGVSGGDVSRVTGYGNGASGFNPDGTLAMQYSQNGPNGTRAGDWTWSQDGGFHLNAQQRRPTQQGSGGGGNLGFSPGNSSLYQYNNQNPYLAQMSAVIGQQIGDNLGRNILPQVRSGAQAVGGLGGSRQGVVEANALHDANQQMSNAITGMYYGDYNNQLNRQMQQYQTDANYSLGMTNAGINQQQVNNSYNLGLGQLALGNKSADNSYNLGMGQLALGNKTADNSYNLGLGQLSNQMNIAGMQDATNRYQSDNSLAASKYGSDASLAAAGTAANASLQNSMNNYNLGMRNADISELTLANNMFNSSIQGMYGAGQGMYNIGSTQQQAPWGTIGSFNSAVTPYSGFGQSQTTGGGVSGAAGGALAASQMWNNMNGNAFQATPGTYVSPGVYYNNNPQVYGY